MRGHLFGWKLIWIYLYLNIGCQKLGGMPANSYTDDYNDIDSIDIDFDDTFNDNIEKNDFYLNDNLHNDKSYLTESEEENYQDGSEYNKLLSLLMKKGVYIAIPKRKKNSQNVNVYDNSGRKYTMKPANDEELVTTSWPLIGVRHKLRPMPQTDDYNYFDALDVDFLNSKNKYIGYNSSLDSIQDFTTVTTITPELRKPTMESISINRTPLPLQNASTNGNYNSKSLQSSSSLPFLFQLIPTRRTPLKMFGITTTSSSRTLVTPSSNSIKYFPENKEHFMRTKIKENNRQSNDLENSEMNSNVTPSDKENEVINNNITHNDDDIKEPKNYDKLMAEKKFYKHKMKELFVNKMNSGNNRYEGINHMKSKQDELQLNGKQFDGRFQERLYQAKHKGYGNNRFKGQKDNNDYRLHKAKFKFQKHKSKMAQINKNNEIDQGFNLDKLKPIIGTTTPSTSDGLFDLQGMLSYTSAPASKKPYTTSLIIHIEEPTTTTARPGLNGIYTTTELSEESKKYHIFTTENPTLMEKSETNLHHIFTTEDNYKWTSSSKTSNFYTGETTRYISIFPTYPTEMKTESYSSTIENLTTLSNLPTLSTETSKLDDNRNLSGQYIITTEDIRFTVKPNSTQFPTTENLSMVQHNFQTTLQDYRNENLLLDENNMVDHLKVVFKSMRNNIMNLLSDVNKFESDIISKNEQKTAKPTKYTEKDVNENKNEAKLKETSKCKNLLNDCMQPVPLTKARKVIPDISIDLLRSDKEKIGNSNLMLDSGKVKQIQGK